MLFIYFSPCKFAKFLMSFLKAQVSFLQNLQRQTKLLCTFFSSKYIIYFGQRNQLKSKFYRFSSAQVKIRQVPHVNFEMTSFFIVMTHNSSANFKLIHFLLWMKESHQSPSCDTFKYFGENLPNSSCHFSNHKTVFLQILHHFSVS